MKVKVLRNHLSRSELLTQLRFYRWLVMIDGEGVMGDFLESDEGRATPFNNNIILRRQQERVKNNTSKLWFGNSKT